MREDDGRKLSHEALEQIRIDAVMRVEAGESPGSVTRALGLTRPRIYEWLAAYRRGGIEALRSKPVPGRPMKLPVENVNFIFEAVTTKTPMQMEFESALWSRDIVRELICRHFGIRVSKSSVVRLLSKLGLSAQRPLARAYQRDPELTATWMREQYPEILKKARSVSARIMFVDVSMIQSDCRKGKNHANRGRTSLVEKTNGGFKGNLISAINSHGEARFMFAEDPLNVDVYVDFVTRLLLSEDGPIFVIADGQSIHQAKEVKQLAAQSDGRLHMFQLSRCSSNHVP
ncbi:IS630 family transposase [Paraburkholderia elongata]|uniref:IS630 family transposase n=1 Tax=Paraburkholderia elongata TaxID=2675747 RepID=A0A972NL45_9BURK|nr:IS630 family transposase [Paraburkholderia elongata]NPT55341.1 IS630 family transposase [Paraburkholderia elongata]